MSKKNMKLGVASALAIGAGAAIVAKKSKKSEKKVKKAAAEQSEYRNTERGKYEKNSKGIYYSNGNYEAFARPESRREWMKKTHILLEAVWLHSQQPAF